MLVLRFIAATFALICRMSARLFSPLSLTQSLALSLSSLSSLLCCLILWRTHKNAIRLNAKLIKAT